MRNRPRNPAKRLRRSTPTDVGIAAVVRAELAYGARHSAVPAANLRLLDQFLRPICCIPFDAACADQYGLLREDLARRAELIGPNDMLIAATALAHGAVLVTHNTREFSRVVGLHLDDWWKGE